MFDSSYNYFLAMYSCYFAYISYSFLLRLKKKVSYAEDKYTYWWLTIRRWSWCFQVCWVWDLFVLLVMFGSNNMQITSGTVLE